MTHDWDQQHRHDHHGGHGADQDASSAELAGFLAGLLTLPERAVDLGCGTGADAVFLAQRGIAVTGLDGSDVALTKARERAELEGVEVEWILGDVLELPFDDASLDLALDRGCLHHVAAADQPRYAAEVARVLRPGGTLLVRELNHAGHHAHAASEESLRAMIEGTTLEERSIVRYGRTMLATFGTPVSVD